MSQTSDNLLETVIDRIHIGILVVDRQYRIVLWNRFMENYSGRPNDEVVGRVLFEEFTSLPVTWLTKKITSVFMLGNFAFTNWQQRPYLFKMPHDRPITGGVEYMHQNCTFMPVLGDNGETELVCIAVEDVTENAVYELRLRNAMQEIEYLSAHDGLTGLLNRRSMEEQLESEVARSRRYSSPCSIVVIDLDHFKEINDTYGHLSGDEVLKHVSHHIHETVRGCDTAARYGGDEFVLVLPETSIEGARCVAERVQKRLRENPVSLDGNQMNILMSAGVAEHRYVEQTGLELFKDADQAVYVCKKTGGNSVVCYSESDTPDLTSKNREE